MQIKLPLTGQTQGPDNSGAANQPEPKAQVDYLTLNKFGLGLNKFSEPDSDASYEAEEEETDDPDDFERLMLGIIDEEFEFEFEPSPCAAYAAPEGETKVSFFEFKPVESLSVEEKSATRTYEPLIKEPVITTHDNCEMAEPPVKASLMDGETFIRQMWEASGFTPPSGFLLPENAETNKVPKPNAKVRFCSHSKKVSEPMHPAQEPVASPLETEVPRPFEPGPQTGSYAPNTFQFGETGPTFRGPDFFIPEGLKTNLADEYPEKLDDVPLSSFGKRTDISPVSTLDQEDPGADSFGYPAETLRSPNTELLVLGNESGPYDPLAEAGETKARHEAYADAGCQQGQPVIDCARFCVVCGRVKATNCLDVNQPGYTDAENSLPKRLSESRKTRLEILLFEKQCPSRWEASKWFREIVDSYERRAQVALPFPAQNRAGRGSTIKEPKPEQEKLWRGEVKPRRLPSHSEGELQGLALASANDLDPFAFSLETNSKETINPRRLNISNWQPNDQLKSQALYALSEIERQSRPTVWAKAQMSLKPVRLKYHPTKELVCLLNPRGFLSDPQLWEAIALD